MRGEQLLRALGHVDPALIEEAEHGGRKKQRRPWKVLGSIAACFVLLAALSTLPDSPWNSTVLPEHGSTPPPISDRVEQTRGDAPSVDLSGVRVFALDDVAARVNLYYDPEKYDEVYWYRGDIIAYYGWDLTPPYLPAGFAPRTRGISATVS